MNPTELRIYTILAQGTPQADTLLAMFGKPSTSLVLEDRAKDVNPVVVTLTGSSKDEYSDGIVLPDEQDNRFSVYRDKLVSTMELRA